jgi:hypothetical protein
MITRRFRAALTVATAAAGALALLAGTAPALAGEAQPLPPRPIPDWFTGPLACGGVKMGPLPAPALSINPEPSHPLGDWYEDGPGSTNPCTGHNFVLRTATGRYLVWFPMATPTGSVGIVPGSSGTTRCTVTAVDPSPPLEPGTDVRVACATAAGAAVDSRFTVRFERSLRAG